MGLNEIEGSDDTDGFPEMVGTSEGSDDMEGSNDGTSEVEGFSLGCLLGTAETDGTEDVDGCSDGCAEILGEDVLLDLLDFAAVLPIMAAEYCS